MKERPILFSGPMVRAILAGQKTQTRRLIANVHLDPHPNDYYTWHILDRCRSANVIAYGLTDEAFKASVERGISCPYGVPGGRLWVRETHAIRRVDYDLDEDEGGPRESEEVYYHATPRVGRRRWVGPSAPPPTEFQGRPHSMTYLVESSPLESGPAAHIDRWTPSIHMPRWASRIDLEIVAVRVERLQDITEQDAQAEGITAEGVMDGGYHVNAFANLWDHINGDRATWASNPWVWVVEFKRVAP